MSKFRTPWPWEEGGQQDDLPPGSGQIDFANYAGVRLVPNTTCGIHRGPVVEIVNGNTGERTIYCSKCKDAEDRWIEEGAP